MWYRSNITFWRFWKIQRFFTNHWNIRILIWTASYPPILGGLQTVTQQLARGLSARGHTVLVLTNRYPVHLPAEEEDGAVRIRRIRHYRPDIPLLSPLNWVRKLRANFYFPASRRTISQLIQSFAPDIINIHFPDHQLPYWPTVGNQFQGRLVVSVHGHEVLKWFDDKTDIIKQTLKSVTSARLRQREALCLLFFQANAITACSSWMLEQTLRLVPEYTGTTQPIYNAVDLARFEENKVFKSPAPYLFSFARLAPHKGFDLLFSAFAHIRDKWPKLELLIGGDGPALQDLQKMTRHLGATPWIYFLGRLSPEEIVSYAKGATAVVIPSKREPFGISVLEALASGKPVVATDVGGIPEAAGGLALLCQPTVEDMAQKLSEALRQDTDQRDQQAIRRHLSRFSLANFLDTYEKILIGKP